MIDHFLLMFELVLTRREMSLICGYTIYDVDDVDASSEDILEITHWHWIPKLTSQFSCRERER